MIVVSDGGGFDDVGTWSASWCQLGCIYKNNCILQLVYGIPIPTAPVKIFSLTRFIILV